jgi:hypothetical protein
MSKESSFREQVEGIGFTVDVDVRVTDLTTSRARQAIAQLEASCALIRNRLSGEIERRD